MSGLLRWRFLHGMPPWPLVLAACLSAAGVLLPLGHLVWEVWGAAEQLEPLFTGANLERLVRTGALAAGVLAVTSLLALPAAWLSARTDLVFRRSLSVAVVLPLSVPAYVMAYAWLSLGGDGGVLARVVEGGAGWFGGTAEFRIPRLSGYWGALLVLSAYNLPYLFLPVRAALLDVDAVLEEASRSLGKGPWKTFGRVVVPQIAPAYFAGAMLVLLHVLADFGAVSLMRYDTLSAVLYQKYNTFDVPNAAGVGLLLLLAAGVLIALEMAFLRRLRLERVSSAVRRRPPPVRLGAWQGPAVALCLGIFVIGVLVPILVVFYWCSRLEGAELFRGLWPALADSLRAALPAAVTTTVLAIPIAMLRARYASGISFFLERLPFVGYAVPALAFALSWIMLLSSEWVPDLVFNVLYQSLPLLVLAYTLHFLAEAVGPIRSSFYLAPRRLEEAARTLGRSRTAVLFRVTLPLVRSGLLAAMTLVFLSCLKELPLTMLLAPLGFETLAQNVWNYSENVEFSRAAPFALAILACSALFTALLLRMYAVERPSIPPGAVDAPPAA